MRWSVRLASSAHEVNKDAPPLHGLGGLGVVDGEGLRSCGKRTLLVGDQAEVAISVEELEQENRAHVPDVFHHVHVG